MKKYILFLLLITSLSITSCFEETQQNQDVEIEKYKYDIGKLVYVGKEEYVVWSYYFGQYKLKKIDCRTDNCFYIFLESEIRVGERVEITNEELENQNQ